MKDSWLRTLAVVGIVAAYGLIDASESFDSRESSGGHHEAGHNTPRTPLRSRPPMGGSSGMAGGESGSGRGSMGGRVPMGDSGSGSGRGSMGGRPPIMPRLPMGSGGGPMGRRGPMSGSGSGSSGKGIIPGSGSSDGDDRSFFPGDGKFNRDDGTNDFTPWFLRPRAFGSPYYPGFGMPSFRPTPFSPSPFPPRSSFGFPLQRPYNPSPWGWNSWSPNPNPWQWGFSRRSSWSPFFGRRWDDSLTDSSFPDFLSLRTPQLPAGQLDLDRSDYWGEDSSDSGITRDASRGSSWGLSQRSSSGWPWWLDGSRQTPFSSSSRQYDDHHHRGHHNSWSGSWGSSGHSSGGHDGWGHHSGHSDDDHHGWGHWDSPTRSARPDSWGGSWSRSIGYDARNYNDRSAFNPFNSWFGRQAAAGTVTPPTVTGSTDSIPAAPIAGDDLS